MHSITFVIKMNFHTRKWVKPEDLNPNNNLFGGRLLQWIDEEAALYTMIQFNNRKIATKFMSEVNFVSSAVQGDIVELGIQVEKFGTTSITLSCIARNKMTHKPIVTIDNITMVNLGEDGKPKPHGRTEVSYSRR
ncbi:MAG: acyl-CoA thioesterase YciA [Vicingaceae bacterium]|jgi:acyl-CoA thioesterase YciA